MTQHINQVFLVAALTASLSAVAVPSFQHSPSKRLSPFSLPA